MKGRLCLHLLCDVTDEDDYYKLCVIFISWRRKCSTLAIDLMGVRASGLAADTVVLALTFVEAYRLLRFCGALKASTIMKVMVQQGSSSYRIPLYAATLLAYHSGAVYFM